VEVNSSGNAFVSAPLDRTLHNRLIVVVVGLAHHI